MKKSTSLILLCFATLSLFSCKKAANFDLEYNNTFVVPASSNIQDTIIFTNLTNSTGIADAYSNHKTDQKHVVTIQLSAITFTITNPTGKNFDFMQDIEIYIDADGLPERLISTKIGVPENGTVSLNGDLPTVNLIEYLSMSSYSLKIKLVDDQHIPQDYTINCYQKFSVQANEKKK